MQWGAVSVFVAALASATPARAETPASTPAPEDARRAGLALALHVEPLGGPVGVLGAGIRLGMHRFVSLELGAGVGLSNVPQGASAPNEPVHVQFSAMLRGHLPARFVLGIGFSEGYFRSLFETCDGSDGNCRHEWGPPPRARWLNTEIGGEYGSDSWRPGFAVGVSQLLNAAAANQVSGVLPATLVYAEFRLVCFLM